MMTHCFEQLGCVRVQFKTDRNVRPFTKSRLRRLERNSRACCGAICGVGMGLGSDSAFYSVIADDWPAVRKALEQRLLVSKDAGR